jgi:hypothetical protein
MVSTPEFRAAHVNHPGAFTRKSPLSFLVMILMLAQVRPKSMAMEMHEAAKNGVAKKNGDPVSGSAFSKRCKLLKYSALKDAFKWFYNRWLESEQARFVVGKRRLLAIDGTAFWMTPNLKFRLELNRIEHRNDDDPEVTDRLDRPCQMRSVIMHDILNDCVVDISYDLDDIGERQLAIAILKRSVRPGDIVLFDRGYPAAWLLKLLRSIGASYVIRMVVDTRRAEVAAALNAEGNSTDAVWRLSWRDNKWLKKSELEYIPNESEAFRCVRGKSGKEGVMLLATDLPATEFSDDKICDFYRLRWGIETAIGRLKGVRDIEAWSGRSLHRLDLDIWGAILGEAIESHERMRARQAVEQAEREREERRKNPPAKRPPGRPPKTQGTHRSYNHNKLNIKQFHTMFRGIFMRLMMNPSDPHIIAARALILRQSARRASWTIIGRSPPRHITPEGYPAATRRRAS